MDWKNITLPFWMNAGNSAALVRTANRWFFYVKELISWPAAQYDIDKAALFIVDLLAWERDVQRFNQEPEWLYRRRVKFAYANARDAGSVAGFKKIWARMELGYIEIEERLPNRDWDVVRLLVTESAISEQPELLAILIEKYGRTCRRYELTTISNLSLSMRSSSVVYDSETLIAKLEN